MRMRSPARETRPASRSAARGRGLGPLPAALALFLPAALAGGAAAQTARRLPREKIWPAPTAEDWKKPVAVRWQRTWEDALAVARAARLPILVCVNMDGEIASEHYAGVVYRRPETRRLFAGYVPVVASVYRHNPRDHDEKGRRIPCPRFGTVTCGEHIAIETLLYEKYFDGKRIAPRHLRIDLEGAKSFDVMLTWDVVSVLTAIREGAGKTPPITERGDRDPVDLVASRDSRDRERVEKAFLEADPGGKRRLLEAAFRHPEAAPGGLLRLALHELDPGLVDLALRALARTDSPDLTALLYEALNSTPKGPRREALLATLRRLAERSVLARRLSAVEAAASGSSGPLDLARWRRGLETPAGAAPADRGRLAARLDALETRSYRPDPRAKLEFAAANVELALDPSSRAPLRLGLGSKRSFASLLLEDAERAAREALSLGASDWHLHAVLAVTAQGLGRPREALAHAVRAVPAIPPGEGSRLAMKTLETFAYERQREIIRRIRAGKRWPHSWIRDLHAAYAVLDRHPFGTDRHFADHYDFLHWLKAHGPAARCLRQGLERFPASPLLHARLRRHLLRRKGPEGLEREYRSRLAASPQARGLPYQAALASLAAAEAYRRAREPGRARDAYDRALDLFRTAGERDPATEPSCAHGRSLALAGKARIALEAERWIEAAELCLAAFAERPESAAARDGLNLSAVDTAKMCLTRLREAGEDEAARRLAEGLGELDPALLALPPFERGLGGRRSAPRRRR